MLHLPRQPLETVHDLHPNTVMMGPWVLTTKGFRNGRSPRHTHRLRRLQQDRFEVQESWIDRVVVLSVCDAVDMQRSTVDGSDT